MFINIYMYIYIIRYIMYVHIHIYCISIYYTQCVYIYIHNIYISVIVCIYIYITAYNIYIYIYCYMVLYALEYVCVNDIIQHICCVWYTSILHAHGYSPIHKCMHSVVYGSYTDTYVCACTDKYIRTQSAKHAAIWWLLAIFQVWQAVIS